MTDNNDGETSVLSSWTLNVDTGKPYVAEKGKKFKATKTPNAAIPDRAPVQQRPVRNAYLHPHGREGLLRKRSATSTSPSRRLVRRARPPPTIWPRISSPRTARSHTSSSRGIGSGTPTAASIGPLTLDDEAPLRPHGGPPGLIPGTLGDPGWGRSRQARSVMDDGRVKGNVLLIVLDGDNTETSNLVSWSLKVQTGSPYRSR